VDHCYTPLVSRTYRNGFSSAVGSRTVLSLQVSLWVWPNSMIRSKFILGTSIGGLFLPLLLPVLIKTWGITSTLRILSIAILIVLVAALPFLRGRLPDTRVRARAPRPVNRSYLRSPLFWVFMSMNLLQALAFFVPVLWLPCGPCFALYRDRSLTLSCSIRRLHASQQHPVFACRYYAEW
jgi:hypothetical protein